MTKFALICLLFVFPMPAYAYVGPGIGLTAIGAALAFFAAVFLVIVGFVWYPVKRLRQRLKAKRESAASPSDSHRPEG